MFLFDMVYVWPNLDQVHQDLIPTPLKHHGRFLSRYSIFFKGSFVQKTLADMNCWLNWHVCCKSATSISGGWKLDPQVRVNSVSNGPVYINGVHSKTSPHIFRRILTPQFPTTLKIKSSANRKEKRLVLVNIHTRK